ncbi:TIGR00730 family Rossman fold protein [Enterovirga sp.]|uniref:LOG family protein n=1 Tax=Enterovirga sp. TaxID=2026350 RepID=UPI002BB1FDC7|nr:TIGR00730 family Rossman fold protein [Enterovirga sp.]HMO30516.1 TIGR00730 family Rossman fold protein [Enterovirga sp.]
MRENIPAAKGGGRQVAEQKPRIRHVCIYCGSSSGADPVFEEAATELGRRLAQAGISLVYGGGDVGLMGAVARAVLGAGGHVTGIIPDFLRRRENMIEEAQELVVVRDMHTRKRMMFDRADAFVALPGGIGTLEELVEQMTWSQLGRHRKPILLLDVRGFWRPLVTLLDHMRAEGFIRPGLDLTYLVTDRVEKVLPMLDHAFTQPPTEEEEALIQERF